MSWGITVYFWLWWFCSAGFFFLHYYFWYLRLMLISHEDLWRKQGFLLYSRNNGMSYFWKYKKLFYSMFSCLNDKHFFIQIAKQKKKKKKELHIGNETECFANPESQAILTCMFTIFYSVSIWIFEYFKKQNNLYDDTSFLYNHQWFSLLQVCGNGVW